MSHGALGFLGDRFRCLSVGMALAGINLALVAEARPESVPALKVQELIGERAESIVVISLDAGRGSSGLRYYRPHILHKLMDGQINWPEFYKVKSRRTLAPFDEILIDESLFGRPLSRPLALKDCTPRRGISIPRGGASIVYLASCRNDILEKLPPTRPEVGYDLTQSFIETKTYKYSFKKNNEMLFDKIEIKESPRPGAAALPDLPSTYILAKSSDLLIRSDIKNFFTLNFDSTDIESHLKRHKREDFAVLGTLSFFLKIAFFKISLDLDTNVSFFKDSSHIPMVLTIPASAEGRLNPKSGLLYSFELGDDVVISSLKMPELDPEKISNNWPLSKQGQDMALYCHEQKCHFSFGVSRRDSQDEFKMSFMFPEALIQMGVYPRFVGDVEAHKKSMLWDLKAAATNIRRSAFYLEVSDIKAGEHMWDLWMSIQKKG